MDAHVPREFAAAAEAAAEAQVEAGGMGQEVNKNIMSSFTVRFLISNFVL